MSGETVKGRVSDDGGADRARIPQRSTNSIFQLIDDDAPGMQQLTDSTNPRIRFLNNDGDEEVMNLNRLIQVNSHNILGNIGKNVQQDLFESVKKSKAILSPYTVVANKQAEKTNQSRELLRKVANYKRELEVLGIYSSYAIDDMVKSYYEKEASQLNQELESRFGNYVNPNEIIQRRSQGLMN